MYTPNITLVVDLDGTLIKTDILHETFWSAFSKDWKTPFKALTKLLTGKAKLKEYLNNICEIDIKSLPYDKTVIEYIKQFRSKGGHTVLVTASNITIAKKIADHLGFFDEVHGSTSSLNLKGEKKMELLISRFGKKKFSYIGDSSVDIPIWKHAFKAISVNAGSSLKKECNKVNQNCEHLKTNSSHSSLLIYSTSLRPHQWLKNTLVFLPMLAAHKISSLHFLECLTAFIAFSLISSSVYVTNDLLDLGADRAHPRKKDRPFASGSIPINHGIIIAPLFLLLGISITFFINKLFLIVLLTYYALTTAYSLILKRKAIIDICTLAGLYTIRIIGGGAATQIGISFWLLGFSIFIFLSLAAVKRQAELVDLSERGNIKTAGRSYSVDDLPMVSIVALIAGFMSVLVIVMYVNSPEVLILYPAPRILWGVCCVLLYWLIKIIFLAYRGEMHDDPLIYAVRDRMSQFVFVIIAILILLSATPWE
jgi:4-hydroxybenzoate polyprenyltransferase/phosphoserine phosphatase